MTARSRRTILGVFLALLGTAGVAKIIQSVNYWYRQQWHFVASMQDLPPEDRSRWKQPPAAWSRETMEIQAATPTGLKRLLLSYYRNSIGMRLVRVEPGTFEMGLTPEMEKEVIRQGHPVGGPMYIRHRVT